MNHIDLNSLSNENFNKTLKSIDQKGMMMSQHHATPQRSDKALKLIALLAGTWAAVKAQSFFVPVAMAMLIAFLMVPIVTRLRKTKMPEWLAIILTAIIILFPIVTLGIVAAKQAQLLIADSHNILNSFERGMERLSNNSMAQKLQLSQFLDTSRIGEILSDKVSQGAALLLGGIGLFVDASSKLFLIFILSLLMVIYRAHLRKHIERILVQSTFLSSVLLDEAASLIQKFLVARMILVIAIGLAGMAILRAFGVNYSIALGGLLGLMTLVPAIGFIVALLPILIVALATGHSFLSTLGLTAALVVLSFIEGNILTPRLVGRSLNINALASFLGLFGGGLIWGVWGMLLSVPILGVIRIIFSAFPGMQAWGDLLSEREDRELSKRLLSTQKIWTVIEKRIIG